MTGSLPRLAKWASEIGFADLPQAVVEAAKSQLFSTLASVHAGYLSDLGAPIEAAFGARAGNGARAIPAGTETSPGHAAFLMAAWGIVLDFDDIMLGGHIGHSAALVPLAYAEPSRASGADLLLAQVTANEVAGRVGMTVALGAARGQMASHVHLLGAAAARAKIERLDAGRFAESLGFALSQPPRPLYPGFLGSDAKALGAAWPVRMGLESVDAVKAGLAGNAGILDGPHGFIDTAARIPVPEFLGGLGERWHTATDSIKIYPACGYLNAALDATLSIVRTHDVDPSAVESVEVRASIFTCAMDAHSSPHLDGARSRISTLTFSTPYTVACAIVDRDFSVEHLERERIADPRVWEIAKRVRVVHDVEHTLASLLADLPIGAAIKRARRMNGLRLLLGIGGPRLAAKLLLDDPRGLVRVVRALGTASGSEQGADFSGSSKRLSATVRLTTTRGERYEATTDIPRGFAGSADGPALRRLAREKYRAQASRVIGVHDAARAAELIDRLEQLEPDGVAQLVRLNCAAREPGAKVA